MRGETLIFVCSYGCVVGPDVTGRRVVRKLAGEGPACAPSNQPALPGGDWLYTGF